MHADCRRGLSRDAWCRDVQAAELLNEGQELVREGKTDAGLAKFDRAIALIPDWWPPRYAKANALRDRSRYREALQEYRVVRKLRPGDCEAAFWFGRTLVDAGDSNEAIGVLREVVSEACTEHKRWARVHLAVALEVAGQRAPAILEFTAAARECPSCLGQEPAAMAAVSRLEASGARIRQ